MNILTNLKNRIKSSPLKHTYAEKQPLFRIERFVYEATDRQICETIIDHENSGDIPKLYAKICKSEKAEQSNIPLTSPSSFLSPVSRSSSPPSSRTSLGFLPGNNRSIRMLRAHFRKFLSFAFSAAPAACQPWIAGSDFP